MSCRKFLEISPVEHTENVAIKNFTRWKYNQIILYYLWLKPIKIAKEDCRKASQYQHRLNRPLFLQIRFYPKIVSRKIGAGSPLIYPLLLRFTSNDRQC